MDQTRINAAIISLYMNNIDQKMLDSQKQVVVKYNPGYRHYQVKTVSDHATSMDILMRACLEKNHPYTKSLGNPDVIFFLDIDCIPLNKNAFDNLINQAAAGFLVGNAQRSNHIQNNEHVFVGPHCLVISLETFKKIGFPSANPNIRGDVGEEWTYASEMNNVPVKLFMPEKYDAAPFRQPWETNTEPFWCLAKDMPNYGIGTTYESGFWHLWQSFYPGQLERFLKKCTEVYTSSEPMTYDGISWKEVE